MLVLAGVMLILAFLSAVAQPAPASPVEAAPPPAAESRFGGLFVDWRVAAGDALMQEQARAEAIAPIAGPTVREARALGDQVGEMVALGDCDGGERLAREAGDVALLRAVQDHCRRQVAGVLAARPGPDGR